METDLEFKEIVKKVCCPGYSLRRGICLPVCDQLCENSKCTAPNVCSCNLGYVKFSNYRCIPQCENCNNGFCTAPNICECYSGFDRNENGTCKPICNPTCINGNCIKPDYCKCYEGYHPINQTEFDQSQNACEPNCKDGCIFGNCTGPNTCECWEGYEINSTGQCTPICLDCSSDECIESEICAISTTLTTLETEVDSSTLGYSTDFTEQSEITTTNIKEIMHRVKPTEVAKISCESQCINGWCENEQCHCNTGYIMARNGTCILNGQHRCNNRICISTLIPNETSCNCMIDCQSASCVETNLCKCGTPILINDFHEENSTLEVCDCREFEIDPDSNSFCTPKYMNITEFCAKYIERQQNQYRPVNLLYVLMIIIGVITSIIILAYCIALKIISRGVYNVDKTEKERGNVQFTRKTDNNDSVWLTY